MLQLLDELLSTDRPDDFSRRLDVTDETSTLTSWEIHRRAIARCLEARGNPHEALGRHALPTDYCLANQRCIAPRLAASPFIGANVQRVVRRASASRSKQRVTTGSQ